MSETHVTLKNAMSLGAGTLVSRVLGLARDILFAYILGAGLVADIFLAAFRIPHFFRRLLFEGGLAMSFIPIFRQTEMHSGTPAAFTFGRTAIMELFLTMLGLSLLFVYGSDAVASAMLPGYADNPEVIEHTGRLIRITMFYLPLAIAAALMFGMLIALRRFAAPAFGSAVINVGLLAAAAYVLASGSTGFAAAVLLCVGLLFGAALQLILPLADLMRRGYKPFGPLDHQAAPVRTFLRAMPASAFGSASYQMTVILAMFMASFLGPGHISALYFAERLLELPLALIGVSLATAGLGRFTKLSLEEQREELSREIGSILSVCFFLTLPAAVGILVFALPIVEGIFGHGAFGPGGVTLTTVALVFYAPALPAVAGARPLLAALNSRGRTVPTVAAALLSLGVMFIAGRLLMPRYEIAGIALSATLAAWCNLALLTLALKKARMSGFFPWKNFGLYTGLSLVMGALAWLTVELLERYLVGDMGVYPRLAVGIVVGIGIYFCLAALARSRDLVYLRRSFGLKA